MKKTARKIPATMATQHPDHASRPYWHKEAFIPTLKEAEECFLCFSDLGISEYKWDWEGKLVDESVLERLLAEQFEFFKKYPLGKERFLTFRLPNPKVETEFRLGRALMGMLTAASLARQTGLHTPPMFEVILPMTESAEEMIDIQEAFAEVANLKHRLYNHEKNALKHIEIVPLFESVQNIAESDRILEDYLRLHKWKFGFVPRYMRPYVARSDPALNSGLVPTILAIKVALSRYRRFEEKHKIKLFPVIGVGSLPFRGGINPLRINDFIKEYKGIRTAIIQSAFRYDFPKDKVKAAIQKLDKELPKGQARVIPDDEEQKLLELLRPFEAAYQKTIEKIAPLVNHAATHLPKRRERVLHTGLFGYNRGVGKVRLPRAISFTAALYSLGVPPELIGTGRGLKAAAEKHGVKLVKKYYVNLKTDMQAAGGYLNKNVLKELAKKHSEWADVQEDVRYIENILGIKLGPKSREQKEHAKLSEAIYKKLAGNKNPQREIEKAALLRHSMG